MKTLQEQYNLLKEGKGHKGVFIKSALRQFPQFVTKFNSFEEISSILKSKQVLSEGIGGVATGRSNPFINWKEFLSEETAAAKKDEAIKAVLKEPNKEVVDMETRDFDYKDPKNIDNLYGEAFLQGYYTELKDPANADKTEVELKEIVAKNLTKDKTYYTTEAQFGIKGIGYKEDLPGLGPTKEVKGKYASGGMEEVKLKENKMIKLTDLINESIAGYIDLRPIGMTTENARTDAEEEGYKDGMRDEKEDLKDKPKKKKAKKESIDTKLAEIGKQGDIVKLEAQIAYVDESIDLKNERITMVTEDENLSELVDKTKMKEMQREVKDLERRRLKMEKLYEKMCGKAYSKPEMVDEVDEMEY